MREGDDCPNENDLVGFLEGLVSDTERAAIEAHCARCERCREGLADAARESIGPVSPDAARPLKRALESAVQGVVSDASAEAIVGKRIGRFEVVAVQGRGQFGVVYRARDTQLGRLVAVKVMRPGRRQDRSVLETLFHTEAAAAARLQHPNIVTLHDHGEFEGAPYLILELLDGETLRSRLEREARLAPRDALAIAGDVAGALVEAHAAGVIHRDIKPGNVFLCSSGQIKVLDLGLAQLQDTVDSEASSQWEAAVARAGTPRYMAPELFDGHAADACTDVYAVGLMLFEMLVGPSPTGDRAIEERIARAHLPRRLHRLLWTATASDRASRFPDAGALQAALTRARDQLTASRIGRRVGVALAGVLVVATAAVGYRSLSRPEPSAKPAVAVLGFDNRSRGSEDAWLSTALSEMLVADLAGSPALRVASPAQVAHARADLGLPEADCLEPRMLPDLQRYLGVDYVVCGSYSSVASRDGNQMRLDVRIQDTWGIVLDSFSETGSDGALLDLVARIASRMRVRLSGAAISADEAHTLRASMPATTEAARLYSEGLRRSRNSDLVEARDLFARAIAAEPSFPLAHSAFSQVLHTLGEEARMREEAGRAFELSQGLRTEERLLVEARYREAIGEWPQARELRRVLHQLIPDDLEYGLELVEALELHGQREEALAVINELRRLPLPRRDDPRIDLSEIWAQAKSSVRKALAISAADKARTLGARWVLARARMREATAERELGEIDRSLAAAYEARALCESLGDREGRSIALYEIATTHALRGDPISAVIAAYEEALQLERELGNSDQVANMLGNIAFEYLMAGDPGQAAPRIDEMDRLATGRARIHAEEYRAMQWQEQGDLPRAFAQYERLRQSGKSGGFELKLLGEVLTAQGELAQARARLEQFLARDWAPDDDVRVVGSLALSRLDIEDGQLARAEARARDNIAICERTHNESDLPTAQAALAHVLVAAHRYDEAKVLADSALRLATRLEAMPEWIDARIALARALAGLNPHNLDAALAEAQAALARASERGLLGQAYEARLAAGEIAAQARRPTAPAQLRALADEADQRGFGLIARKARAVAAAAR